MVPSLPPQSGSQPDSVTRDHAAQCSEEADSAIYLDVKGYISRNGGMALFCTPLQLSMRRISKARQVFGFLENIFMPRTYRHHLRSNFHGLYEFSQFQKAFNWQDLAAMDHYFSLLMERLDSQQSKALGKYCLEAAYLYSQSLLNQGFMSDAFYQVQEVINLLEERPVPEDIREYVVELGYAKARALEEMMHRPPLISSEAAWRELQSLFRWGLLELKVDFIEPLNFSETEKKQIVDLDIEPESIEEFSDMAELSSAPVVEQQPEQIVEVSVEMDVLAPEPEGSRPLYTPEIIIEDADGSLVDDVFSEVSLDIDGEEWDGEPVSDSSVAVPFDYRLTRSMGSYEDLRILQSDARTFWDCAQLAPPSPSATPRSSLLVSRKISPV